MKLRLYLLTVMLCLMMPLCITAQAQTQQRQQRACSVIKQEQFKQQSMITSIMKDASGKFSNIAQKLEDGFPKQAEEKRDSANVTLKFAINDEHPENFMVLDFMIYNLDWSHLWYLYSQGISEVEVVVPFGTYDIQTQTYDLKNPFQAKLLNHIDELITIDKDTTITIQASDAPNLISCEFYDSNDDLLQVDTYNAESWQLVKEGNCLGYRGQAHTWLENYGPTQNVLFSANLTLEGNLSSDVYYVNDLSSRYSFVCAAIAADKNGVFYVNRLIGKGLGSITLKNSASDYVSYEERILSTPKGLSTIEKPSSFLYEWSYHNNEIVWEDVLENGIPIAEDHTARVMINAPKNGDDQLQNLNIGISLGLLDYEKWIEYEDGYRDRIYAYNLGPEVMANQDHAIEFLIHSKNIPTPGIDVWKTDYPAHSRFSFTAEQKKNVNGNCCPLVSFDSRNGWIQWLNANSISILADHVGRNGEQIGSANFYSTMTAKYNGNEVWKGKLALDSLSEAWAREHLDGAYELTFINENIAVDDIPGINVTTVYFDQRLKDQNPPVLKMLQFRDTENNVTDRFDTPDEGIIMFAGGDFDYRSISYMNEYGYESTWNYYECQPMTIEVSYAPYGTDEWQSLEGIEHQAEYDDIPGMGFFYQGSLAGVSTPSENGWFDLKFRLVDEAGNWQEQTLNPAFRIDALVQSAVNEVKTNGNAHEVARYSIDGKRVDASHSGIAIVKMSDGTARKILVP